MVAHGGRERRILLGVFWLFCGPAAMLLPGGCVSKECGLCYRMLFAENKEEYQSPGAAMIRKLLYESSNEEKARILEGVSKAVYSCKGYARVAAAEVLLCYAEEHPQEMTDSLEKALVDKVIAISRTGWGVERLVYDELDDDNKAIDATTPICPLCVVWFDAKAHVLKEGLPKGWTAEDGQIELDGTTIRKHEGKYEYGVVERYTPSEVFRVLGKRPRSQTVKVKSSVVLVSPRGKRYPKEREMSLWIGWRMFLQWGHSTNG